jgi:hypothetical protein
MSQSKPISIAFSAGVVSVALVIIAWIASNSSIAGATLQRIESQEKRLQTVEVDHDKVTRLCADMEYVRETVKEIAKEVQKKP